MDISALFTRLKNANFLRRTTKTIRRIERFEEAFKNFGEADFAAKTLDFKKRVADGETVPELIPEAFALVRTAARRLCGKTFDVCGQPVRWNMVHYDVQLRAGIALANNSVCEIATGEGKTLIATLPAYVYALFGRGCHIATVNEYLAGRDCQWMSPLYNLLGLACDCVFAGQSNGAKKAAYAADITYGTAAEFGFDYLRDNSTTFSFDEKVQRGFFFCLVDEADSVLVDEARTPLIISGGDDDGQENPYAEYIGRVRLLAEAQNKLCGRIANGVFDRLKSGAKPDSSDIEKLAQVRFGAPRNKVLKRILKLGVANVELEKRVTELSVNFGENEKLRLLENLYYYVDEKNSSASLTKAGQKFLEPDNPDAFVVPDAERLLAEIDADCGLADSEKSRRKAEVAASLSAAVERLRIISQLLRAFSLYERDVDYIVRKGKVEIVDPNTGRVMEGRRWSDGLHQAVEAKEGLKIGAENITYATISIQNYFKMYEKLSGMTGTAAELSEEFLRVYKTSVIEIPPNKPCVRIDNPDLVFLTRSEKYARIVETAKSVAASGRPVLVGTGSVEESEILSKMLKIGGVRHSLLNAKNDAQEAALVARAGGAGTITVATNMAGRGTDIKLDDGVNERGGLFIISSEHNYSRRIDRQLMGRCVCASAIRQARRTHAGQARGRLFGGEKGNAQVRQSREQAAQCRLCDARRNFVVRLDRRGLFQGGFRRLRAACRRRSSRRRHGDRLPPHCRIYRAAGQNSAAFGRRNRGRDKARDCRQRRARRRKKLQCNLRRVRRGDIASDEKIRRPQNLRQGVARAYSAARVAARCRISARIRAEGSVLRIRKGGVRIVPQFLCRLLGRALRQSVRLPFRRPDFGRGNVESVEPLQGFDEMISLQQ